MARGFPTRLKTQAVRYPKGTMAMSTAKIVRVSSDRRYAPKGLGSAIKWLTYYLNRAGKSLPADQKKRIEEARDQLQKKNNSGPYKTSSKNVRSRRRTSKRTRPKKRMKSRRVRGRRSR